MSNQQQFAARPSGNRVLRLTFEYEGSMCGYSLSRSLPIPGIPYVIIDPAGSGL
ncbi:hypothetical protein KSU1_B0076 [Candidatus Jettenia caeni]|uniref:Uncharacterized protein n=1 Tax=Candidatus Jettenia caeni TaxID=247490 RepID=I3IGT8_9BACT|nr:hypothetical protein [Candidatus Jettenia sp. AMX1]NUO09987.1 hypothetical protein [Candidatus Brocadia sp.]GAB60933.1 hypothetical protein KSU1_B0076 [Candidatus Jettenia caeni]